jgi:Trypsin-like serine proteases, typically periplasmic, contain C-terminal PDZ domain
LLSFESEKEYKISSIGSSDASRVGDTVFAVGAPLDNVYSWTVTRGIISGKDRMVEVSTNNTNQADYVMKVMQTDAAINSGNSGGPLCNSNGEVIGINSLKLVSSGIEGMGFAIPIENAIKTADRILNNETYVTPFLGVSMLDLNNAYTQYYDVITKSNLTKGVIVVDVSKNSPAENAGLKAKDIIVKINDVDIKNVAYLRYTLYQYKVGDKINVSYYRDGQLKTTDVVLKSNSMEA